MAQHLSRRIFVVLLFLGAAVAPMTRGLEPSQDDRKEMRPNEHQRG